MERRTAWLFAAILILLAAILPYRGAIGNGFVYDDVVAVERNERVHGLAHWQEILSTEYWNRRELPSRLYRPVTLLSIAAEHQLLGPEPGHFHLTNLLLHAAASILVFGIVGRALRTRRDDPLEDARDRRDTLFAAGAAGILFAMHPLHSEAVLPIVGRAELLSALFTLLTVDALLRGGRARWIAPFAACLALLSKESAALVVPYIALLAFFGLSARNVAQLRRWDGPGSGRLMAAGRDLLWIGPGIVVALLLRWNALHDVVAPKLAFADNPLVAAGVLERVGTSAFLFTRYLVLHLLPEPLVPDYSYAAIPVTGLSSFPGVAGLVTWFFLAVAIWFLTRLGRMETDPAARGGLALAGLGLSWFALGTLLSSNLFFLIGTLFAERLSYLPGIGLFLVFAALVKAAFSLRAAVAQYVAVSAVIALFAAGTVGHLSMLSRRTAAWSSNLALFRQATIDQPRSFRVWVGLGESLMNEGKLAEAEPALLKSLAIYPDFGATHNCLMSIYHDRGKFDQADTHARRLKQLVPMDPRPYFVLSESARRAGDPAAALEEAKAGMAGNPDYLPLRLASARAAGALGRTEEAIADYRLVIEKQPQLTSAKSELGPLLVRLERWDEAVALYRQVVADAPDWAANNYLAWASFKSVTAGGESVSDASGRLEEAQRAAEAAVSQAPENMKRYALDTCAQIRFARGERAAAIALMEQLVAALPGEASYRETLQRWRAAR